MRKKFYSLVCAGFMMVMAAMQVQAADIKNVNGFSVETADYNTTVVLDENSAEGTAVGIEPRGSIIDTATTRISNLGKGDIGIIIETLAHVECDKIKILQYCSEKKMVNGWRFLDIHMMPKRKIFRQRIYRE